MSVSLCVQETEFLPEQVTEQLERILSDHRFASTERNANFLRYVVERTLEGKADEIKEVVIANELYGRPGNYDPKVDSIVRVEATRVRSKLRAYYEQEGRLDPIRITIPKGGYVPQFEWAALSLPSLPEPETQPVELEVLPIPSGTVAFKKENRPRVWIWLTAATILIASVLWWFSNRKSAVSSPHPDALAAWQEGNELLRQDPHNGAAEYGPPAILLRAIERYEFAVAKEPKFAQGWASLAEGYDYAFPYVGRDASADARRANAAAERAVALDAKLPAGHAMLGLIRFYLNWDFAGAEAAYRRAIELDPRNPYAVVEYADLLRETGRIDQAAAEVRRARALSPALPVLAVKEAEIQLSRNRPDEAIATATAAIQLNRDYRRAYVALGMGLEAKGDFEKALAKYRENIQVSSEDRRALPAYGYLLGVMGRHKEARAVARQLEDINRRIRNSAFQVAVVYVGLGEHQVALDWLERAWKTHQVHLPFAAIEYRFKPLHKYPRFHEILDRVGLKVVSN